MPIHEDSSLESFAVTLNANNGSVSPASLNAARTVNYIFQNWNTESDGSGTSYHTGDHYDIDADVMLFAQWDESIRTSAVELPVPVREGYVFKGWGSSADAVTGFTDVYTPSGNVTLYAIWNPTYTISYDSNGGSGSPAEQIKEHDVALTLSYNRPSRANSSAESYIVTLDANGGDMATTYLTAERTTSYSFKNWNTKADGSGTDYAPGRGYYENASVTLYAQWKHFRI